MSLDTIASITINLRESPIGLASFSVPLLAVILTSPQDTAWDAAYGATVDVIEVTGADWQTILAAVGITSSEDAYVALSDVFA